MSGFGFPLVAIGAGVAVIAGALVLAGYEQKQWDAFAKTHECVVVGEINGFWSYGLYAGKYQNHYTPGKTVYKCNDGIEYTR